MGTKAGAISSAIKMRLNIRQPQIEQPAKSWGLFGYWGELPWLSFSRDRDRCTDATTAGARIIATNAKPSNKSTMEEPPPGTSYGASGSIQILTRTIALMRKSWLSLLGGRT